MVVLLDALSTLTSHPETNNMITVPLSGSLPFQSVNNAIRIEIFASPLDAGRLSVSDLRMTRNSNGQAIHAHPHPLEGGARALLAWMFVDPSYDQGLERVFVSQTGPARWRVLNIPLFVYGLTFGSTVQISVTGQILGIIQTPPSISYRLTFSSTSERERAAEEESLHDWAVVEPGFGHILAIQAKPGQSDAVAQAIERLIADGRVTCAENVMGLTFDPGPAVLDHAFDAFCQVHGPILWNTAI